MSFINYGGATVETYNDVAGGLHIHSNTTNIYYNGPCVVIPPSRRKHKRSRKKKKESHKPFIQFSSLYDGDDDKDDDNLGFLRLVGQLGPDPSCYTGLAVWTVEGVAERVDETSSDLFGMMLSDPNPWIDNKKSEKTAEVYLENWRLWMGTIIHPTIASVLFVADSAIAFYSRLSQAKRGFLVINELKKRIPRFFNKPKENAEEKDRHNVIEFRSQTTQDSPRKSSEQLQETIRSTPINDDGHWMSM